MFLAKNPIRFQLTVRNLKFLLSILTIGSLLTNCRSVEHEHEEHEDGMAQAMHQEFLMTRDPATNTVPKERLLAAMSYLNASRITSTQQTTNPTSLSWTERGPNNIGGRTRAIMIDKRDPTGNTVFAGSVSGGIFKTTNFQSASPTWAPVNDQMANLAVTVLVQDKNNLNTMYAGTGEGWFNIDAVRGAGVFKSIDGGTTWTQLASTANFEYIQDFLIDNNGNLYVSLRNLTTSFRGVMRSTNGGTTWTQVLGLDLSDPTPCTVFTTGRAADLEVASNGDVYATLGVFSRTMVFKSTFATFGANTGAKCNWTEITPPHSNITFRAELAVAPSNSQRLYLMLQDSASDQVKEFYRSNDGGITWDSLPGGTNFSNALNNGSNSQTWYDLTMAVDSTNADIVVVGGLQMAKSTDAGNTWNVITSGLVHVDQHASVYLSSSKLIIGNDGGIYLSTDANLPAPTWTPKNATGYNVTQFYGCDFHPNDDNYFLAGAQDNNTQKFTSPGINVTTPVIGGDGGIPHIHQTDGVIQIAATTGNNYYRSTNSGGSFSYLSTVSNNRGQFIDPTDYDNTLNAMFCGDDPGQYYVITGLAGTPTGTVKNIATTIGTREVTAVKMDPVANTVWLGCSLGNAVPMVLKVSNATASPSIDVSSTLPSGGTGVPAGAYISSIDIDPANANHLLVVLSNYGVPSVWESTNAGTSWNNIEGNLPDMPIHWGIFAPATANLSGTTPGGIILGTELGVWTTSAIAGAGTVWVANNTGLANVPVYQLRYKASSNIVAAATHGRGLYTTVLPGVTTGVSTNVITKDFIKYISANESQLLIVKGNLNTQKMQVQIYDANGQMVFDNQKPYQDLSIDIAKWSRGVYTLRLLGNNKEYYVRQFVK